MILNMKKTVVSKKSYKKGGENIMKRLLAVLMLFLAVSPAFALPEDTVELIVNPLFTLSVAISSATNSFQEGTNITLGESRTMCVGTIVNDGNVTTVWRKQSANAAGATTNWTLETSGVVDKDCFRLLAVTTSTITQPDFTAAWDTNDDNALIHGDHDAADGPCVTDSYTWLTEGGTTCPEHSAFNTVLSTRALWVSIMMPSDISEGSDQTITLSVQAYTP